MIKYLKQNRQLIHFNIHQLFKLGAHLGHTKRNSNFLAMWAVHGYLKLKLIWDVWSYCFFLLNMHISKAGLKSLLRTSDIGGGWTTSWFITHDIRFKQIVIRYASIIGEVASVSLWVAGCLTNCKYVMAFIYMILIYIKAGFKLNHRYKKIGLYLYGICFSKVSLPFLLFYYKLLSMPVAVKEGINARVPSFGIIDNDNRGGVKTAIVSNDDSIVAINFYFYYCTKKIFVNKLLTVKRWRSSIRKITIRKSFFVFWFYYYYYKSLNYLNDNKGSKIFFILLKKLNTISLKGRMHMHTELSYLLGKKTEDLLIYKPTIDILDENFWFFNIKECKEALNKKNKLSKNYVVENMWWDRWEKPRDLDVFDDLKKNYSKVNDQIF